MKRRLFLSFIALVALAYLPIRGVRAMEISPSLVEVQIDPGQAQTRTVTIKNNESQPQTYYFQLQKFLPRGEQGQQDFLPLEDVAGLPSWTYLQQPSLQLQPNESRTVQVSIRIPESAAPGGYYEALFVSNAPMQGQRPLTSFRTGTLFLVTVKGNVQRKLQVTNIESPTGTIAHLPVRIGYTIENLGGIHERPQGFFVVRNSRGRIIDRILVNEEGSYVLPGSRRQFSTVWSGFGVSQVNQTFWGHVKKEWADGFIGPYTGSFELDSTEGRMITAPQVKIVIWPWHLLFVLGLLVLSLLVVVRMYRNHLLRNAKLSA